MQELKEDLKQMKKEKGITEKKQRLSTASQISVPDYSESEFITAWTERISTKIKSNNLLIDPYFKQNSTNSYD